MAGGDSGGEEAFRQSERPAVHGNLRAENQSFRLSDGQEDATRQCQET